MLKRQPFAREAHKPRLAQPKVRRHHQQRVHICLFERVRHAPAGPGEHQHAVKGGHKLDVWQAGAAHRADVV